MDTQKPLRLAQNQKSRAEVCFDTLPDNLTEFRQYVVVPTNCDLDGQPHPGEDFSMSQKKCRFCS